MKIKLTAAPKKIKIHTPFINLDGFLKLSGEAASGAEAKDLIGKGNVRVNGEVCLMRGKKLVDKDQVLLNGRLYEVSGHDHNLFKPS